MILLTVYSEEKSRSVTATTMRERVSAEGCLYSDEFPEDKQLDAFLATDCIASEKLVSGEYNQMYLSLVTVECVNCSQIFR